MKREAGQHGVVKTCRVLPSPWSPKHETRSVEGLESQPAARLLSNDVPSKSSNHSKFTGRCGRSQCLECHLSPISKSKDKTKGTQKLRTNHMFGQPNVSGFSASGFLEHLDSVNEDDEIDDYVKYNDADADADADAVANDDDDDDDFLANFWYLHENEKIEEYDDDEA